MLLLEAGKSSLGTIRSHSVLDAGQFIVIVTPVGGAGGPLVELAP
jgi:hypothetical protein